MGGGKQRRAMERNAAAQERIAGTQERTSARFLEQGEEDRAFQREQYERILPVAEGLTSQFDPTRYAELERPDVSAGIRRDYSDETADIEQNKNRALAVAEDYYTSSGLGRTGIRGQGMAGIVRGSLSDRGGARRRMQNRLTDESLNKYQDALSRRDREAALGVAGANIMAGQQGVFDPTRSNQLGAGTLAGAAGTQGSAAQTSYQASRIPTTGSIIGGIAGGALSLAAPGAGGLKGIWKGGRT